MTLDRTRRLCPQLTKSQKRIADYGATSYHQVAFMTSPVLAKQLDINEATIIRFAQRLNYQGYPEFVASIQSIVKKELSATESKVPAATLKEPLLKMLTSEDEVLRRAIRRFPVGTGAKTFALSCSLISQVAQAADLAQSCPANVLFGLLSITALAAFIDALLQIRASRHRDALREHHAHIALARSRIVGQGMTEAL